MRRFKGFTLTELMIALAVIGIIVAVVTPAIMKTRPNKNKMMIKKTFYTTEQIVATLINDARLYPDVREACYHPDSVQATGMYCAWGFDYDEEVNYDGVDYSGDTKFGGLFKAMLNVKGGDSDDELKFFTTDGVRWDLTGTEGAWESRKETPGTFDDQSGASGIGTILIDVNGDEAPNCRQGDTDEEGNATCSEDDFDQYEIQILASGKLQINPDDAKAVEYVTINTSIRDAL